MDELKKQLEEAESQARETLEGVFTFTRFVMDSATTLADRLKESERHRHELANKLQQVLNALGLHHPESDPAGLVRTIQEAIGEPPFF